MLTYHVNTWTEQAKQSIIRTNPPALKILQTAIDHPGSPIYDEVLAPWRVKNPTGLLLLREVFDGSASQDVGFRCAQLLASATKIKDLTPTLETPWNEEHESLAELPAYAVMTNQAVDIIEAAGYDVVVGNFSVGQPGLGDWMGYWPALGPSKRKKYLGLHEYSAPTMQDGQGWYCLRYRSVYAALPVDLRLPLLITECGIDRGVLGPTERGRGWKYQTTAAQYASQLAWYAGELLKDKAIGFIFACGTYKDFELFDVAGVAEVETVITGEHLSDNLTIGTGLRKGESIIGPFTESETYDAPGTDHEVSKIATVNGWGTWTKKTNETVIYRVDGAMFRDWGNHSTNGGQLQQVSQPFS